MSHKHPKLNAKQLIKILEDKGFRFSRQNGSHAIYISDEGQRTTVPVHGKKELGVGLLKQIMKDTGLSTDDLENAWCIRVVSSSGFVQLLRDVPLRRHV